MRKWAKHFINAMEAAEVMDKEASMVLFENMILEMGQEKNSSKKIQLPNELIRV